jgi:60 kDa SS-A/Ro ribonucleoprotein
MATATAWTHRDLLRLSHPVTTDPGRRALFEWTCRRTPPAGADNGLRLIEGYTRAQTAKPTEVAALVHEYRLSWEMLPDAALAERDTWAALLDVGMPQTALMRQLPRLTRLGLLSPMSERTRRVAEQLTDSARLHKGRVHPISVLVALRTYASGHSARGDGQWAPAARIVDALDAAFYRAFATIEPTGKRHLLALDVSSSMMSGVSGLPLTAREASAAMALVTAATEPNHEIVGFHCAPGGYGFGSTGSGWQAGLTPLSISPRQRLENAIQAVSGLPFGGTDCALPMLYALGRGLHVDMFTIYTDNETWAGQLHPHQALQAYRQKVNPAAKLAVVAMTSTGFSIADPNDSGMLDVAGFDSAVPGLLADFARDV